MARTLDWVLYDTQDFGTTASVVLNYFQVREGSSAAANKFVTNMRGDGNLPQAESFVIHKIGVWRDDDMAEADVEDMWINSYLQLTMSDKVTLQAPLRLCAMANAYGGHFTQATAALNDLIGLVGDGYKLSNPVKIEGGTNFRIEVGQGTALSAANLGVKVSLIGLLTLPD